MTLFTFEFGSQRFDRQWQIAFKWVLEGGLWFGVKWSRTENNQLFWRPGLLIEVSLVPCFPLVVLFRRQRKATDLPKNWVGTGPRRGIPAKRVKPLLKGVPDDDEAG